MEDIDAIYTWLASFNGAKLSQIVSKLVWPIIMHIILQWMTLNTEGIYIAFQSWMNRQNNKFWEAIFGRGLIFFAKL